MTTADPSGFNAPDEPRTEREAAALNLGEWEAHRATCRVADRELADKMIARLRRIVRAAA